MFFLDPSNDNSASIIREQNIPNLKLIESEERKGFAAGLNEAVLASKGDVLARMDGDDICLPWRFQLQVALMEGQSLDALYSTAVVFGKSVRPFGLMPQFPNSLSPEEVCLELLFRNPLVHPTLMIRREAFETIGGYSEASAEDYDLALRLCIQRFRIARNALPTVAYRIHPHQATANAKWNELVESDPIISASRQRLEEVAQATSSIDKDARRRLMFSKRPMLKLEARGVTGIIRR